MKKFVNWLRQGKSRGLLIVLLFSVLLASLSYSSVKSIARAEWQMLTQIPDVQSFLQEFPELTIKVGQIQGDVVWARMIPIVNVPVVVNSSSTQIALDAQPGIYITQSQIVLQDNGVQESHDIPKYSEEVSFSLPVMLDHIWNTLIPAIVAVSMFFVCWAFFLFTVLLSWIIASIARVPHGDRRVWRTSMIASLGIITLTLLVLQVLQKSLSFLPSLCLSVIISILMLYGIGNKKKEI